MLPVVKVNKEVIFYTLHVLPFKKKSVVLVQRDRNTNVRYHNIKHHMLCVS